MWFKQRKTITAIIEATIEPPTTADGHRLEEFVVCYDCGQFVLRDKAKEVKHCYGLGPPSIRYYCPHHTPAWDIVDHIGWYCYRYYRRIPAVPERLEEIVEAPKRKARPKKEAN